MERYVHYIGHSKLPTAVEMSFLSIFWEQSSRLGLIDPPQTSSSIKLVSRVTH